MTRILVVENDSVLLDKISDLVTSLGYKSEIVTDRSEVLRKFMETQYHIVIIGLQIPKMKVVNLIEELRGIDENAGIIAILDDTPVRTLTKLTKLGIYNCVRKAFLDEDLKIALNRELERRNLALHLKSSVEKLEEANKTVLQYQQQLKSAQEKIIQGEKLKVFHQIASFVVHDLKNSASVLSLIVENSVSRIKNEVFLRQSFEAISDEIKKMNKLIGTFLHLPRKLELRYQRQNINELIKKILNSFEPLSNIKVIQELSEIPLVDCDGKALSTVFYNLIKNSCEAMPNGGELRVTTAMLAKGPLIDKKRFVKISISDTGSGIPQKILKDGLFNPFQSSKKKGLGIGLYQSKEIIEKHAGEIHVKSKWNEGTTCTLILPVAGLSRPAASGPRPK